MKLEILIRKPVELGEGDTFTHFWNNNGEDFWDTCKSEIIEVQGHKVHKETEWDELGYASPMDFYLDTYFPNYTWKDLDTVKIQRANIDGMQIQMSIEEVEEYKNFFFKVTDGNTISYYYCSGINQVSDPNNSRLSYVLDCELDLWASYWALMHSYMKKFYVELAFANKMADRFIFNYEPGKFTYGFYNDFIEQQWLCRTNQYTSDLYCYDKKEPLTLEEWEWVNSEEFEIGKNISEYKQILDEWENKNCPMGSIFTEKGDTEYSKPKITDYTLDPSTSAYYQNAAVSIMDVKDSLFNSNGKYRYLVCKIANNRLPENPDENIKLMFSNIRGFQGDKYNTSTPEKKNYTFNGETLAYIPFIKGSKEDSYLKILNNNEFGITLGNGYAMGMPINDIPPSIFATALRRKNYLDVKEGGEQSIGDIASLRNITHNGTNYKCPMDYVNINITGKWEPEIECKKEAKIYREQHPTEPSKQILLFKPDEWGQTGELGYYFFNIQAAVTKGEGIYMHDWQTGNIERIGSVMKDNEKEILMRCTNVNWLRKSSWYQQSNTVITTYDDYLKIPYPTPGFFYHITSKSFMFWREFKNANLTFGIPGIPCIFTDFSYIPVALTRKRNNNVYGWSDFINKTLELYQNDELTRKNSIESEPLFLSPGIWRWTYYIDGIHKIEITNNMLDLKKMMEDTKWDINLNVIMSTHTSYLLDFKDIRNKKYPITKIGMEFISEEYTNYPFTTEAYNNWLQSNQAYIETAKNAKDIDFKWRMANNRLGALLGIGEEGLGGAGSGAMIGGIMGSIIPGIGTAIGAIGGGIAGGAMGMITNATGFLGKNLWTKRAYQETMEQFNNQIQGMKNSLYSSPSTTVNPSGFNAGSLIYSPSDKAIKLEYEMFKLYTIPDIVKSDIWKDISWNGYQFASQCKYIDYNNRVNFNVVNCNLLSKSYMVINYLKENIMKFNPLFSQMDAIDSFIHRCANIIRLFKCKYDINNMDKIIENNIELQREWVLPYQTKVTFNKK